MAYIIKIGTTGELVEALQAKLASRGVLAEKDPTGKSNIDGKFGRITLDAVIKFQQENNLVVDGIVGQDTASALDLMLAEPTELPRASHILTAIQLRKFAEVIDSLIPIGPVDLFDDSAIAWLTNKLDGALAELLPPKILGFLNDLSKGIDGHDLGTFKKRLTQGINQQINLPLVSEETEEKIISFFVTLVLESLQTGRSFNGALMKLRTSAVG